MPDSGTFNGTENIALLVRETADATCLVLKTRLSPLLHVAHVTQVPHEHLAVRRAYYQFITTQRHRVHALGLCERACLTWRARIPRLHCRVPASGDYHVHVWTVLDAANGVVVHTHHHLCN